MQPSKLGQKYSRNIFFLFLSLMVCLNIQGQDSEITNCSKGDYDCQIAENTNAINFNQKQPKSKLAEVLAKRGKAYLNKLDYERALTDYNKALELAPKNAKFYAGRGDVFEAMKELNKALADFNKAVELDANYPDGYDGRGVVYSRWGNYSKAILNFNKAIKLDPQNSATYYNRGSVYYRLNNDIMAIKDFTQTVELAPTDIDGLIGLGTSFTRIKNQEQANIAFDRAIVEYSKLIEQNPNHIRNYIYRGLAYSYKKERELSHKDFNQVIELAPQNPEPYFYLELTCFSSDAFFFSLASSC